MLRYGISEHTALHACVILQPMSIWCKERVSSLISGTRDVHGTFQPGKRPASCHHCLSPKVFWFFLRETFLAGTSPLIRLKTWLFMGLNSSRASEGVLPKGYSGFFSLKAHWMGGRSCVLIGLTWSSPKLR